MIGDLFFRCDACHRGLIRTGREWWDPCPLCKGRGSISLASLCERIGEHESTVRHLLHPRCRSRPKVAARICAKVVDLITPKLPKQPELFL